jgi:hypothetical protein
MKPTQLEVLLCTDSRFATRQYTGKYGTRNQSEYRQRRNLEEACRNGHLRKTLPELYRPTGEKDLALWRVTQADHFLDLEYGGFTKRKEFFFSVNPYLFLGSQLLS